MRHIQYPEQDLAAEDSEAPKTGSGSGLGSGEDGNEG